MNIDVWNINSWRNKPIKQDIVYDDIDHQNSVYKKLKRCKGLVSKESISDLKNKIKDVIDGNSIIFQSGDCAETFSSYGIENIEASVNSILNASSLLGDITKKRVISIGRIAGQYTKPRSSKYEFINGEKIFSYRGDMVNGIDIFDRVFDPNRMFKAYKYSKATNDIIRDRLYISHEGLHLGYENCFTREFDDGFYNLSTNLLWLGERTRDINGAHVEYLRGIQNPIGIKVSSNISGVELIELIDKLNPTDEKGKVVLIFRIGNININNFLINIISKIKKSGRRVAYIVDPMHGNTIFKNGYKIRDYNTIVSELNRFISLSFEFDFKFGGIHLESTSKNVTECIDSSITIDDISYNYDTFCDPRLNNTQLISLIKQLEGKF